MFKFRIGFDNVSITLKLSIRLVVMVRSLDLAINVPVLLFWRNGRTLCVRPPGYQSAYKADVYGMFLVCKYTSSCAIIFTDCYAVLKAVNHRKERVVGA